MLKLLRVRTWKLTKIVVEELQELTCDKCQKMFSNKLLLITHQKLIHIMEKWHTHVNIVQKYFLMAML